MRAVRVLLALAKPVRPCAFRRRMRASGMLRCCAPSGDRPFAGGLVVAPSQRAARSAPVHRRGLRWWRIVQALQVDVPCRRRAPVPELAKLGRRSLGGDAACDRALDRAGRARSREEYVAWCTARHPCAQLHDLAWPRPGPPYGLAWPRSGPRCGAPAMKNIRRQT